MGGGRCIALAHASLDTAVALANTSRTCHLLYMCSRWRMRLHVFMQCFRYCIALYDAAVLWSVRKVALLH